MAFKRKFGASHLEALNKLAARGFDNELAEYLGLPNLRNNYLAIYEFTSKEVANELTAFYLSLE